MLEVYYFQDGNGDERTTVSFNNSEFPSGVEEIYIQARYRNCSSEFALLSNILSKRTDKLRKIYLHEVVHMSPEFLSFFMLISRKTTELILSQVMFSEGICESLVGAIKDPDDGLRVLIIRYPDDVLVQSFSSDHLVGLLLDAISSPFSSIEHLSLITPYLRYSMEACGVIARTLRQSQSLLSFELVLEDFLSNFALESIVSGALFSTRLEHVKLNENYPEQHNIRLSTLVDGLCREGCNLKTIDIWNGIALDMDLNSIAAENSSVLNLRLGYTNLTCTQFVGLANLFSSLRLLDLGHSEISFDIAAVEDSDLNSIPARNSSVLNLRLPWTFWSCSQFFDFAKLFSSLQSLDISLNPIDELKKLGTLLLGEASALQRLNFSVFQEVNDDEWFAFCKMIPKMKSLRGLRINNGQVASFSAPQKRALYEALCRNTSLECYQGFDDFSMPDEDHARLLTKLSIRMTLNRAGRHAFPNLTIDQSLNPGLWPLVLERAAKLDYYAVNDSWERPSLSSRRADAVYWLLQEMFFPR